MCDVGERFNINFRVIYTFPHAVFSKFPPIVIFILCVKLLLNRKCCGYSTRGFSDIEIKI